MYYLTLTKITHSSSSLSNSSPPHLLNFISKSLFLLFSPRLTTLLTCFSLCWLKPIADQLFSHWFLSIAILSPQPPTQQIPQLRINPVIHLLHSWVLVEKNQRCWQCYKIISNFNWLFRTTCRSFCLALVSSIPYSLQHKFWAFTKPLSSNLLIPPPVPTSCSR